MVRKAIVAATVACLVLPAFAQAAEYRIDLSMGEGQATRMSDGNRQIASIRERGIVLVMTPGEAVEDRPLLAVDFLNTGEMPRDFGPENIRVCLGDEPCKPVLTHEALAGEARRKARGRAFGAAMAAAANGYAAGMSGQYNGSGTARGPDGRYSYSYSGTDYGARLAAQQRANSKAASDQRQVAAERDANLRRLSGILKTTTVDPQRSFGGIITFDPPRGLSKKHPAPLTLEIDVAGETHRIAGTIKKL